MSNNEGTGKPRKMKTWGLTNAMRNVKDNRPARADSADEIPGSSIELENELSRQNSTLKKLNERKEALESRLEATNTQIRVAEVRARLISESLRLGGLPADQETLHEARQQALKKPDET